MAFWEHPDMALDEFKRMNIALVDDLKSFVSRVSEWFDLCKENRPPASSWNGYFIDALRRHALREGHNQPVDDDEMIARWIARELRSTDFSNVLAVKVLKVTGHFRMHENVLLLKSRFKPYSGFDDADSWHGRGIVDDKEKFSRKYITNHIAYAIDPENSQEIDDAVGACQLSDGRIQVLIHVADPTSIVEFDSEIDREARRRNHSVYLPDCTSLMYPRRLAIGRMSLTEGDWCMALTVKVIVREDGSVDYATTEIEMSYVKVHRLTYEEAEMILEVGKADVRCRELQLLNDVAVKRFNYRKRHGLKKHSKESSGAGRHMFTDYGALNLTVSDSHNPEIVIRNDNSGNCVWGMHGVVEELMVLCGSVVAKYALGKSIPIPYRVGRCEYSSDPSGRYDLGLPDGYVQCTSPLRRYLDGIVHYQLKAALFGDRMFTVSEIDGLINENAEYDAQCLVTRCKQYWVAELFRRSRLIGNSFIGKVLKVYVECLWNDSKKHHARIAVLYEGLFEFVTVVEDVPVGVYAYKNVDVRLEVAVADPDAGTIQFRLIE